MFRTNRHVFIPQIQGWERLCTVLHGEQLEGSAERRGSEVNNPAGCSHLTFHCTYFYMFTLFFFSFCHVSLRLAVQEDLEEERKEQEEMKRKTAKRKKWPEALEQKNHKLLNIVWLSIPCFAPVAFFSPRVWTKMELSVLERTPRQEFISQKDLNGKICTNCLGIWLRCKVLSFSPWLFISTFWDRGPSPGTFFFYI